MVSTFASPRKLWLLFFPGKAQERIFLRPILVLIHPPCLYSKKLAAAFFPYFVYQEFKDKKLKHPLHTQISPRSKASALRKEEHRHWFSADREGVVLSFFLFWSVLLTPKKQMIQNCIEKKGTQKKGEHTWIFSVLREKKVSQIMHFLQQQSSQWKPNRNVPASSIYVSLDCDECVCTSDPRFPFSLKKESLGSTRCLQYKASFSSQEWFLCIFSFHPSPQTSQISPHLFVPREVLEAKEKQSQEGSNRQTRHRLKEEKLSLQRSNTPKSPSPHIECTKKRLKRTLGSSSNSSPFSISHSGMPIQAQLFCRNESQERSRRTIVEKIKSSQTHPERTEYACIPMYYRLSQSPPFPLPRSISSSQLAQISIEEAARLPMHGSKSGCTA